MINLYSDTQTLPTLDMYEAMGRAELGDDVSRADPTVNELEEVVARRFGKEAALLVPSGTMANTIALMTHGRPGDEVYLDRGAHTYNYEAGGLCSLAGYCPRFLDGERGHPKSDSLRREIRPTDDHFPRPRLLWLENTHCVAGGTVLPPERQQELVDIAREHGLKVHIDGARIFNASIALGKEVAAMAANVDSVSFCLSKGLSCPIGSVLVGSADFITQARRVRKRLGGGMRQAGIIAACGLVALESTVERLAEDHQHARQLAESLVDVSGIAIDLEQVQTNMVFVNVAGWKVDCLGAKKSLLKEGVLVSEMGGDVIRLVTHRGITAEELPAVKEAFGRVAKDLIGA